MQGIAAGWNQRIEEFRRSELAAAVNRTLENIRTDWGPKLLETMVRIREGYEWMMPPNWRPLEPGQALRVAKLMREEGLALAWAPSAAVLERVLAADSRDARKAVLLENEGQVLADLDRALAKVDRESLTELLDVAREAIEVYRSGYYAGAQALATAGLSTAIENNLGRTLKQARRDFEVVEDPEEQGIMEWRVSVVLGAIWNSLERYFASRGDPVPEHYNRHASTHRIGLPQYTPENALCGVMLIACTVIEIDWIERAMERFDDGEQEAA